MPKTTRLNDKHKDKQAGTEMVTKRLFEMGEAVACQDLVSVRRAGAEAPAGIFGSRLTAFGVVDWWVGRWVGFPFVDLVIGNTEEGDGDGDEDGVVICAGGRR